MAKRKSQGKLEEALKKALPKRRIVRTGSTRTDASRVKLPVEEDAAAPSLEKLREKFLGKNANVDAATRSRGSTAKSRDEIDDADEEVLLVEPDSESEADAVRHRKAVIMSKKSKRIIGYQG